MIDYEDISAVKRLCLYAKSSHISHRIMTVLADYYDSSSVEIWNEVDLPGMITAEIQVCLRELENN